MKSLLQRSGQKLVVAWTLAVVTRLASHWVSSVEPPRRAAPWRRCVVASLLAWAPPLDSRGPCWHLCLPLPLLGGSPLDPCS